MKNTIIIDGTVYELVPDDTDENVCETCALCDICFDYDYALCVSIHNAGGIDHYIKQQKGGDE